MRAHPAGPAHADVLSHRDPAGPPAGAAELLVLDPTIWPLTADRDADGRLRVGGIDVVTLAAEHGTPATLFDEADFRRQCAAYRDAYAGFDVYYAGKAFLCRAVARWVAEAGIGIDVCTGGELAVALSAGTAPERIGFHGNAKSSDELEYSVKAGVGRVIVDSFTEIERLARIATALGVTQRVLVRVTVGVEAHTHEFIATAHEDQKFGFSLATGAAVEAVRQVRAAGSLDLVGLHSHIGSQIFDTSGFEVSARRMVRLLAELTAAGGPIAELNLGGGLGIPYVPGDDPADPVQFAGDLRRIVQAECDAVGLPVPRLAVEPGRALAGRAGVTLYEVNTVKDVDGIRTYVSVDGGMSDNIRAALYDAEYTCVLASRASTAAPIRCRVVGRHCESGDIVVRDVWLPADIGPGDLLAVAGTGAYCRSLASNYNHTPRPPVVAVAAGTARPIVRRETIEDLMRTDVG
jgi:diaminopimelate decarboxylase